MYRLYSDSIIYVVCPVYKKTGGTELAHQLVAELKKNSINAYITYYGHKNKNINPAFREYVDEYKWIDEVVDTNKNFIIVPEINFDYLDNLKKIQKAIWWMSVDNYIKNDGYLGAVQILGLVNATKALLKGRIKLKKHGFDKKITHFYQSEYAKSYLEKQGVEDAVRLSDYINDSYLKNDSVYKKENYVLYNPKKGFKFTKKIIDITPELRWIPIENMTTEQVKDIFLKSKVYVDFGNHPGKDRFPREAAISGCCVITSKLGSAAFHEDVPIENKYKFELKKANIKQIVGMIKQCLENYDNEKQNYIEYIDFIKSEHKMFEDDVKNIIRIGLIQE